MAKQAYVYSGTDWVPLASEVTNLSSYYTSAQVDIITAPTGLKLLVPTSVAVGSGTGTASASGTVTFTGASSVSLNGVFTSTYDSYRVVFTSIVGSANTQVRLRFRKTATDNTSSVYYSGAGTMTWTGLLTAGTSAAAATSSSIFTIGTTFNTASLDITQPLVRPQVTGLAMAAGPEDRGSFFSAFINASDTFDGFTFFPASGTITGSLSVYGYTK